MSRSSAIGICGFQATSHGNLSGKTIPLAVMAVSNCDARAARTL
jgi:hypothetical protein